MKYAITTAFLAAVILGLKAQALDIVIKTGNKEEIKKGEPKEEDKGPELPKPTQLAINIINTTPDNDFVVSAWATIRDTAAGFIVAQGISTKGTTTTLAQLSAPEGSVFEFKKSEVILMKSPSNVPIKCTIKAAPKDEIVDEAKDEPVLEAKKSIDFWLYLPENQQLPSCVIMFDSL